MTNAKTLSEFLREVLEARHLTERALAEGAGVSQSGISNLVQGKSREPDPRTLKALADYLDMEVFVLFRLLGYLPPADEIYGAYDPMELYVARRYSRLSKDRQQAFLHVLETLIDDPLEKQIVQTIRENAGLASLVGVQDALPILFDQAANWYLTKGWFTSPNDINPRDDDDIWPGVKFGQLDAHQQHRLLALMRHKLRIVYSPHLVTEEDR